MTNTAFPLNPKHATNGLGEVESTLTPSARLHVEPSPGFPSSPPAIRPGTGGVPPGCMQNKKKACFRVSAPSPSRGALPLEHPNHFLAAVDQHPLPVSAEVQLLHLRE